MEIKNTSITSKIILPLVAGFGFLILTFFLLIVNLQQEKNIVLQNISSTQHVIILTGELANLQNQVEQLVISYQINQDKNNLELIEQKDTAMFSVIDEINKSIGDSQERELLKNYKDNKLVAIQYREALIQSTGNAPADKVEQAYNDWKSKAQNVDETLKKITASSASLLDQDIGALKKAVTEIMVTYLLILLVVAVLIGLLYTYLNRVIIKPIHHLILGTKRVAEENMEWNVPINSLDEIGELSQAFNEMTGKLKSSYSNLKILAFQDHLTGLPNRQSLEDKFKNAMESATQNQQMAGVMLLDLDRFKTINDTLGHDVGDLVLREVAGRLLLNLRAEDTVVRLGGDEFVMLTAGINSVQDTAVVAGKILKSLEEAMVLGGKQMYISGSIGIAMYPNDGESASALLKNADIALYEAKSAGRNRYNFYNKLTDLRPAAQLELENDLRDAQKKDQLKVFFQPIVNTATGKLMSVEALLRWQHPALGMLMPHEFVHIAEEIGIINSIGEWVLKISCREAQNWQKLGFAAFKIAINLSPRQFLEDSLVDDIAKLLEETMLPPDQLIMEITENMAMADLERTKKKLKKLSDMGITISIDDFGIGYSSLSAIKDFAASKIKIDHSFIRHIITDPQDTAIVKAIITMGHNMNLTVSAEGVETDTQLALLKSLGCDEVQGFYTGRPLPGKDFENWLTENASKLGLKIPPSAENTESGLPETKGGEEAVAQTQTIE